MNPPNSLAIRNDAAIFYPSVTYLFSLPLCLCVDVLSKM